MKVSELAKAITYIDDELIIESEKHKSKKAKYIKQVVVMVAACMIVILGANYIKQYITRESNNIKSHFIKEKGMENVTKVTNVLAEKDGNKFVIKNMDISSGEMVVIDTDAEQTQDIESSFSGIIDGKDISYEIGYIYNNEYIELQSDTSTDRFDKTISIKQNEKIYWCIINTSIEQISINGQIQMRYKDLVYRTYGDECVIVDAPCKLVVNTEMIKMSPVWKEVYLYNLETKQEVQIGEGNDFGCEMNTSGAYIVYAVTEEGGIINIKDYVTIENEVNQSTEVYSYLKQ